MIILSKSVTIQFRRLFLYISYYKVILLQSVTDSYYKLRPLLQSLIDFITKCDKLRRKTCLVKAHKEYFLILPLGN